jgi:hypothetical protein
MPGNVPDKPGHFRTNINYQINSEIIGGSNMTISSISDLERFNLLLKAQEVAEILGINIKSVHSLRQKGRLPFVLIGSKKYLFPKEGIIEFIKGKTYSKRRGGRR